MINEKYKDLNSLISQDYSNISGIEVFIKNQPKYEYYADGYSKDSTIHVASVTKSIFSILVGIAIEKGYIGSIEDRVLDYFPDYSLKRGEKTIQKLAIRHLLTMTAPYKFKSEPYTRVYSSDNWTIAALDLLGGKGRIGDFKYTTAGIQVLSGIISNSTNMKVIDFANENLFYPLDIRVLNNIKISGKDDYLNFIKNRVGSGWVVGPESANTAGWGLTLRARDMVKIGQLFLNKGIWGREEIVPSKWIEDSVRQQSSWDSKKYGFLWWVIDDSTYAAIGDGGNIIYVSTKKEMVVAIASQFKSRVRDRIELIKNHIEPVLTD